VAGIRSGQGKSTGCKNREGQAKDQFVGFHEGCSSTFDEWVTRYGGDVTRRRINQKSIRLVANIVGIDSWQTRSSWEFAARQMVSDTQCRRCLWAISGRSRVSKSLTQLSHRWIGYPPL
jgi:hypothetical protein